MNREKAGGLLRPLGTVLLGVLVAACVTVRPPGGLEPSKPNLPEAARDNTALGVGYLREGRLDLALEKLRRAVEQDPSYAAAHSTLAVAYAQRGDNDLAESEYRRALELGNDPAVRNNFGVFLCGVGKTAEAERYFMQAARNHDYPTPEAAWANAGVCARKAGDAARANADFREALRINPDFADALAPLATQAYAAHDYLQAQALLQRYERVAQPTAQMLALGAGTQHALGHADAARAYELKLIRNFPDSEETAQLLKRNAAP
ncbi:MAG: pilW [Nevskia sp.]|nr:pilW [Nevskia sp.]